jgi:hypothetical protein
LLALDLAELHNLGIRQRASRNKAFQRAVLQLAGQLRKAPGLSSTAQLNELTKAETLRREMHPHTQSLGHRIRLIRPYVAVWALPVRRRPRTRAAALLPTASSRA